MNKLHVALFGMFFISFVVVPALGCSTNLETTTGAACSIADLNNLYEKNTVKVKVNTTYRVDRNLRPVRVSDTKVDDKIYMKTCNLGVCFPRVRLETDD